MHLSLSLLGDFHVTLDQQPVIFATDRARALLVYLAVEAHRAHRREALADLLWPDYLETAARQNLSQTLTRLRQATGDQRAEPPFLQVNRQTLQLHHAASLTVDVLHFRQLVAAANHHQHAGLIQCDVCIERLTQAVDLYRGPFLAGVQLADSAPFEEWVLFTREQLERQALEALSMLAEHYAAHDDQARAQQYAARQLAIEPWREAAHRQLMSALARSGQRGAALAQYESCRRLLADELAVSPDAATVALAEQIRRGELEAGLRAPILDFELQDEQSKITTRDPYATLARLEPQPDQQLFGVAGARTRLHALLQATAQPWIVAIDGIGGIGKTTLATTLAHDFVTNERFADIAWVSAKQEQFQPAVGLQATGQPALDADRLTDALLAQLLAQPPLAAPQPEKRAALLRVLKAQPCLVVVDNLETVADYSALLPYLRQLANPSKFLLTTRVSLKAYSDLFAFTLAEWSERDVLAFLRYEAETRGIGPLSAASPDQLAQIYRVVGGNPLALKLVIGQAAFLPLAQVLANLAAARGKRVDQLYSYIYWQAWQMLSPAERQFFLALPLVPNGLFAHLALASGLDEEQLHEALTRLIELSLVQVTGDPVEPRYRIHRLTETFLMHEVLKWQSTA